MPQTLTVGKQQQLNKLTDLLRNELAQSSYTEALTFSLCSRDDVSKKVRKPMPSNAVHIGNPKTLEFQICRTTLIPGLLKTLSSNKSLPLPIKIFEIQDIVEKTDNEVGARNVRKLAAAFYNTSSGFENIVGVVDRIMQLLEVKDADYKLRPNNNEMFFPGRSCELRFGDFEGIQVQFGPKSQDDNLNFTTKYAKNFGKIRLKISFPLIRQRPQNR